MARSGGVLASPGMVGPDAGLPHDAGDLFLRATDPLRAQLGLDAWTAIGLPARHMHLPNVGFKATIRLAPATFGSPSPRILPASADLQYATKQRDGGVARMIGDELILPVH